MKCVVQDVPGFAELFGGLAGWQVFASGQAEGRVEMCDGRLRLEYDFHGGSGFVAMRREVELTMPESFALAMRVAVAGPANDLEFKVSDGGGGNAWRHVWRRLRHGERRLRLDERCLKFAWGPRGAGAPQSVAAVELVVVAGPGGRGVVEFWDARLRDETVGPPHELRASSARRGFPPEGALDGRGWRAAVGDSRPEWCVDYGRSVRFGGIILDWPEPDLTRAFRVEISRRAGQWNEVFRTDRARGARTHIAVPNGSARWVRLVFDQARGASLAGLRLPADEYSATGNEFIHHVAADAPKGWFPRYWLREQSYWTPVGSPGGRRRALINEEGLVEVDDGAFSLEPFVWDGTLVTWAQAKRSVSMAKGGVPVPMARWRCRGITLDVEPWVDGAGESLTLHVRYRLTRKPGTTGRLALCVAARPYLVNPPWQVFRNHGGWSPVKSAHASPTGMLVADRIVQTDRPADSWGAAVLEEGGVVWSLAQGIAPRRKRAFDTRGLAESVMCWEVDDNSQTVELVLSVPFFTKKSVVNKSTREHAISQWTEMLDAVKWQAPGVARHAVESFRTAAGHILINREEAAIQPGPRRYTRSWIRDCVIMGAALAKAGVPGPLREFLDWYAGFQRRDGFVPAVVDRDGVDWIVEHDSHGQFLWAVREVARFWQGDHEGRVAWLRGTWPHVAKAAKCLARLRRQRVARNAGPQLRAACRGLLPESASHEGYLTHHVHSYWDDFWGVRGLEAAADVAEWVGEPSFQRGMRREARNFRKDLLASLERVISWKGIDYVPGSVEWADFDPTATSNAVAMLDFARLLPQDRLEAMVATYLDGHRRKQTGAMPWVNYTAYEVRIVGMLIRMGKRRLAQEMLAFFLADQRPKAWNQWPEITWRDPLSPGHVGDVPHTWIAAEYLLVWASMIADEREEDDRIVLAAGLDWDWVAAKGGFGVKGLPTRHGLLDFHISAATGGRVRVRVGGAMRIPPGGLHILPPHPRREHGKEFQVTSLPWKGICGG